MANLLPVNSVLDVLSCNRQRFYSLVRTGVLPLGVVVHLGRRIFINSEKLEEFLDRGGAPVPTSGRSEAA